MLLHIKQKKKQHCGIEITIASYSITCEIDLWEMTLIAYN